MAHLVLITHTPLKWCLLGTATVAAETVVKVGLWTRVNHVQQQLLREHCTSLDGCRLLPQCCSRSRRRRHNINRPWSVCVRPRLRVHATAATSRVTKRADTYCHECNIHHGQYDVLCASMISYRVQFYLVEVCAFKITLLRNLSCIDQGAAAVHGKLHCFVISFERWIGNYCDSSELGSDKVS